MNKENIFVLGLIVMALTAGFALADPTAPTSITEVSDTSFNASAYTPKFLDAIAGNITALSIEAISQTQSWQGYYGNLSGTITLDDASNNTFYNWTAAEPRGEVYATLNNSVAWANVVCFDLTAGNITAIESYYGIDPTDVDGADETYTTTYPEGIVVGANNLTGCNSTFINRDGASQTTDFQNILLSDPGNTGSDWIYAGIVEDSTGVATDLTCFNGEDCDFQLLVNEDGHTNIATTPYYFWVELS